MECDNAKRIELAQDVGPMRKERNGFNTKNCDSSAGVALGYGLDDRSSRVRFPAGAVNFSRHHRLQNGSGARPPSHPMGARGSFLESKAAGE
jgi:hypothetical protein